MKSFHYLLHFLITPWVGRKDGDVDLAKDPEIQREIQRAMNRKKDNMV